MAAAPKQGEPPPLTTASPCDRCGGTFRREALLNYQGVSLCAACKQDYFLHLAQGTLSPPRTPYLFLRRVVAKAIDLTVAATLTFSATAMMDRFGVSPLYQGMVFVATVLFYVAYVVFATGRWSATLGKGVVRLRVVDEQGQPIGYGHAFLRFVCEGISVACLGAGYALALADGERRTLHDRICQTRVVPEGK